MLARPVPSENIINAISGQTNANLRAIIKAIDDSSRDIDNPNPFAIPNQVLTRCNIPLEIGDAHGARDIVQAIRVLLPPDVRANQNNNIDSNPFEQAEQILKYSQGDNTENLKTLGQIQENEETKQAYKAFCRMLDSVRGDPKVHSALDSFKKKHGPVWLVLGFGTFVTAATALRGALKLTKINDYLQTSLDKIQGNADDITKAVATTNDAHNAALKALIKAKSDTAKKLLEKTNEYNSGLDSLDKLTLKDGTPLPNQGESLKQDLVEYKRLYDKMSTTDQKSFNENPPVASDPEMREFMNKHPSVRGDYDKLSDASHADIQKVANAKGEKIAAEKSDIEAGKPLNVANANAENSLDQLKDSTEALDTATFNASHTTEFAPKSGMDNLFGGHPGVGFGGLIGTCLLFAFIAYGYELATTKNDADKAKDLKATILTEVSKMVNNQDFDRFVLDKCVNDLYDITKNSDLKVQYEEVKAKAMSGFVKDSIQAATDLKQVHEELLHDQGSYTLNTLNTSVKSKFDRDMITDSPQRPITTAESQSILYKNVLAGQQRKSSFFQQGEGGVGGVGGARVGGARVGGVQQ